MSEEGGERPRRTEITGLLGMHGLMSPLLAKTQNQKNCAAIYVKKTLLHYKLIWLFCLLSTKSLQTLEVYLANRPPRQISCRLVLLVSCS